MRHRHSWILGTALLMLAATGCDSLGARGTVTPRMQIGRVTPDAPQPIIQVDTQAKPGTTSELTITVRADSLLARRLLATVADVERVVVLVTAADGSTFTATVTKAQLSAGTVSVTFPAVPVGPAEVTLTAYDVDNKVIGTAMRSTTVVAGTTTPVNVPLTLHGQPASSGGSGGGSTTPTTGGVAVNGTISNGPTLPAGVLAWFEVLVSFSDMASLTDMKVDATGRPWISGHDVNTNVSVIYGYDTDGQIARQVTTSNEVRGIGFDNSGYLYALMGPGSPDSVVRYTTSDLTAPPVPVGFQHQRAYNTVESGPGGDVWAGFTLVTKLPQLVTFDAYQHVFQYLLLQGLGDIYQLDTVDAAGNYWVSDFDRVVRVSATDASWAVVTSDLKRHFATSTDIHGDVWVSGRIDLPTPSEDVNLFSGTGQVYVAHYKPDGTYVGKVAVGNLAPSGLYVDPTGNIYMALADQHRVVKYSPTGSLLKTYNVTGAIDLRFGGGKLWVSAWGPTRPTYGLAQLEL